MKTESEKMEISKQAAEIVGRREARYEMHDIANNCRPVYREILLVDDHGACAEIAADRRISTDHDNDHEAHVWWFDKEIELHNTYVPLADFPSRIEATNWAICEAVLEQDKESGNANSAS